METSKKDNIKNKFLKKELVKPSNRSDELLKETEFLCGELRDCDDSLRKMKHSESVDIDVDDDILF